MSYKRLFMHGRFSLNERNKDPIWAGLVVSRLDDKSESLNQDRDGEWATHWNSFNELERQEVKWTFYFF